MARDGEIIGYRYGAQYGLTAQLGPGGLCPPCTVRELADEYAGDEDVPKLSGRIVSMPPEKALDVAAKMLGYDRSNPASLRGEFPVPILATRFVDAGRCEACGVELEPQEPPTAGPGQLKLPGMARLKKGAA
jgi:hypothetical protein